MHIESMLSHGFFFLFHFLSFILSIVNVKIRQFNVIFPVLSVYNKTLTNLLYTLSEYIIYRMTHSHTERVIEMQHQFMQCECIIFFYMVIRNALPTDIFIIALSFSVVNDQQPFTIFMVVSKVQ